jgi:hypothetical protein
MAELLSWNSCTWSTTQCACVCLYPPPTWMNLFVLNLVFQIITRYKALCNISWRAGFLRRGVISPSPNPPAGRPPIFGRPPYLEVVFSIRNPRTRHVVVTGPHITWFCEHSNVPLGSIKGGVYFDWVYLTHFIMKVFSKLRYMFL